MTDAILNKIAFHPATLNHFSMVSRLIYTVGIKTSVKIEATDNPPITEIAKGGQTSPIPPVLKARGKTPSIVVNDVIRIGLILA